MGPYNDEKWLNAWLAVEIAGGQVGIPLLLITLYLSPLRRIPTLYSLLWSCVVWSIIDLLLYYPGRIKPTDPEPSHALCLTQASLHLAQPILTSWCSFALLYDCWIVISGQSKGPNHPTTTRRTVILLIFPWLAFVLATGTSVLVGAKASVDLGRERHFFFCTYRNGIWSDTTASLAAAALLASFYLTTKGVILWINSRKHNAAELVKRTDGSKVDAHLLLRILMLTVTELFALALCIISVSGSWRTRMNDILVASLPLVILIIFASQRDVLNVYVSCAKSASKALLRIFGFAPSSLDSPRTAGKGFEIVVDGKDSLKDMRQDESHYKLPSTRHDVATSNRI